MATNNLGLSIGLVIVVPVMNEQVIGYTFTKENRKETPIKYKIRDNTSS